RYLCGALGRNVENVKMSAAAIKITDCVFLELASGNDERGRSLGLGRCALVFVLGGLGVFGLWVLENQNETRAVGRPFEIVDALRYVRKAHGFTTETIQEPNLVLAAIARGEESEKFSIRAPARM